VAINLIGVSGIEERSLHYAAPRAKLRRGRSGRKGPGRSGMTEKAKKELDAGAG